MADVRTDNDFMLSTNGLPRTLAPMLPMRITTRQQAYRTAAWIRLIGLTLPDEELASDWRDVETAIANT